MTDAATVDAAADWAGAYVHIPFCSRVCPYCDFAVVEGKSDLAGRYVDALITEIHAEPEWRRLDAVFVGGGTPSHIDPALLGRVIDTLSERFGLSDGAEVTLEANPEDASLDRTTAWAGAGFNRVSFGVQSLDARMLDYLGRRHTPDDAANAVTAARDGGIGSISVDLIFGSPGESLDSWTRTVETAAGFDVDHLSTYALTVERGTALGRAVAAGALAPDADDQADLYEAMVEILGGAGYERYEVSNHMRPGHACRYNLTAWAQGEYVAFGMGAHSYRNRERAWRVRRLDTYIERIEQTGSAVQGRERLDPESIERERLMLGLRRTAGVRAGETGAAWAQSAEGQRFIDAGVVEHRDDRIVVLQPLLTDAVARSVLGSW